MQTSIALGRPRFRPPRAQTGGTDLPPPAPPDADEYDQDEPDPIGEPPPPIPVPPTPERPPMHLVSAKWGAQATGARFLSPMRGMMTVAVDPGGIRLQNGMQDFRIKNR